MKIIERNIVGKKSQETCEDGIVVTDDFVAVMTASDRKTIEPLLVQAMLDGQNKSYAVIDGFPIYREGVKAVPCLFSGANDVDSENSRNEHEIVLASDGYKSFDDRTYVRFLI